MQLPHGDRVRIDDRKLREYLLSDTHPVGRHKLRYFESVGFSRDRPEELVQAIRSVAAHGTVSRRLVSPHGARYIVDGAVASPTKTIVVLRCEAGLTAGDIGAVVHRYNDHRYEVEFVAGSGDTLAVLTLTDRDVRPVAPSEILHARALAS